MIRMLTSGLLRCVVVAATLASCVAAEAQSGDKYEARLRPVPVDATTALTTTGAGTLTAVLKDNILSIKGTFEGMNSPATVAHVHRAIRGLRGPVVFDLTVNKATSGTVDGTITLTPAQVENLQKGQYYVQLHTQENPDGQLRGWLLK